MKHQNLKLRTRAFSLACLDLGDLISKKLSDQIIAKQLMRSGTSVGANYHAACRARSRAEFISKLGIVEEECDECLFWIELLTIRKTAPLQSLEKISQEATELLSIVIASIKTARISK